LQVFEAYKVLPKRVAMTKVTYRQSGVDLGKYDKLLSTIKRHLKKLSESSGSATFAGSVELEAELKSGYIAVASVDGVGTKVRVAREYGSHVGIGRDIVGHCVNDILCVGARPVAFMDYIAFDKLDERIFKQVMRGIARECSKFDIELIGGETAEMPGVYRKGEYDLVGFILGVTSKHKTLDGSKIRKGDLIVGLPSNGLHTNGYSLARKALLGRGRFKVTDRPHGWREPLGRALLRPHTNYFDQVYPLIERGSLTGIAHITGGGIAGNLARVLPQGCGAKLRRSLWRVPRIFDLIAECGPVAEDEMFRVFNMGLGMLLIAPHSALPEVLGCTRSSRVVGEIIAGDREVVFE
jgi:phosphoribosylformylglycinamidine cyclo-ligase